MGFLSFAIWSGTAWEKICTKIRKFPIIINKKYQDVKLSPGMALALEPMVNAGGFETVLGRDGWVFKTKDGSLSAHYENTILITEKGVEVLTIL